MIRRIGPPPDENPFVIEEVTDPVEIAASRRGHEQAVRNMNWLAAHWADLLPGALGKVVAVAGQQAFVADTSDEACALARTAHPEDGGLLVQYVSPLRGPRIYGNLRTVAPMQ
jgi:hypothetical protein